MEATNNASTDWVEIRRAESGEDGSQSPFLFTFVILQNVRTGKLRVDVQIPNVEALRFPDDLGVLLRSLGWGMASLGMELRGFSLEAWHDCCEVLSKVDYALGIVE